MHWKICDEVNVVNGRIEKADGTFLEDFFFDEIVEGEIDFNLIIGAYPYFDSDIDQIIKETKADVALNLMTPLEITQRGLDEKKLRHLCFQ